MFLSIKISKRAHHTLQQNINFWKFKQNRFLLSSTYKSFITLKCFPDCRTVIFLIWEGMRFISLSQLQQTTNKEMAKDFSFFMVFPKIGGKSPLEFHLVSRCNLNFSSNFSSFNGDSNLSSLQTSCNTSLINSSYIVLTLFLDKISCIESSFSEKCSTNKSCLNTVDYLQVCFRWSSVNK